MKKWFALLCAALMLTAAAGCSSEPAAENGKFTVGICQIEPHPALDAATKGFKDALTQELGADKVTFIEQNAAGESNTCTTIINDFVSRKVDLILANATPVLQAASAGTVTIPILGTSVTEYGVALGLKDFKGTVGGNISGTSDLAPLDKQAEMIKIWCPDARNVGLLFCSAEPNSKYQVEKMQEYLEGMGMKCTQYPFSDGNDLSAVTQEAAGNSDVIYVPTDNKVATSTGIIYSICSAAKVPVFAGEEGICSGCGVATLSISYYDLGVATGKMAARILKGEAKISDMPIEYAAKVTAKYNKAICAELGLTPPEGYEPIG